ncbi:TlpA family protein disulfide reductase [Flavobacterium agricola]|uniref:TlpA family protein disulfide reductase n=1 Tax=Flavobacterium agricola TaxID=2870839 RepID=A0ABY6M227_9FLAO|nr:TlpA disulfide reductase family protein [Flavobacterium agricola]UYW02591.1 TlpA family protein disulfide reductase [Flavobacterium agricola]
MERLEKVLQQTELQTLNGKKITFNALKGKPVVLNFWFTKCAPCIEEMPALNELAAKYKDQAHFIAITYNNESEVTEFLTKHPFNFTQIVNEQSFIDKMEIKSYPRTFFIDKNGKIARQFPGLPFVIDPKTNERKTNIKPFENILIKMLE